MDTNAVVIGLIFYLIQIGEAQEKMARLVNGCLMPISKIAKFLSIGIKIY
jgi:hypothetical protein